MILYTMCLENQHSEKYAWKVVSLGLTLWSMELQEKEAQKD